LLHRTDKGWIVRGALLTEIGAALAKKLGPWLANFDSMSANAFAEKDAQLSQRADLLATEINFFQESDWERVSAPRQNLLAHAQKLLGDLRCSGHRVPAVNFGEQRAALEQLQLYFAETAKYLQLPRGQ
jgi:hypothetical protein